jgi:hypothetical protein
MHSAGVVVPDELTAAQALERVRALRAGAEPVEPEPVDELEAQARRTLVPNAPDFVAARRMEQLGQPVRYPTTAHERFGRRKAGAPRRGRPRRVHVALPRRAECSGRPRAQAARSSARSGDSPESPGDEPPGSPHGRRRRP